MNTSPRRSAPGPLRKVLIGGVATLVAVVGSLLPLSTQTAAAYTPTDTNNPYAVGTPDGAKPLNTIDLTVSDDTVDPGQAITYTATGQLTAPNPGTTGTASDLGASNIMAFDFRITPDANAPLDRAPVASDFTWTGLVNTPQSNVVANADGSYDISFWVNSSSGMGGAPSFTASFPATVSSTVTPGTGLVASAESRDEIRPIAVWSQPDPTFDVDIASCTGTMHWYDVVQNDGYGTWLAEIHVGTSNPGVEFDNREPDIKFTAANGADITGQITQEMTFHDPMAPASDTGDMFPGTDYQQSLDWPFDMDAGTGTTWLPDGTRLDLSQTFRITNCVPGQPYQDVSWHGAIGVNAYNPARIAEASDTVDFAVPVPASPEWSVRKAVTAPAATEITATTATTVTRQYTVTVANSGTVAGAAPDVIETPAVPAGMTVQSATVDGAAATIAADGTITIAGGQNVAAGGTTTHDVVVTYGVDPTALTAAQWSALGSCTTSGGQATSGPASGIHNAVAFPAGTADSDGPDNNDVCTNVTGTPAVQIIKKINDNDADTTPGVTVAPGASMAITFDVTNTGNQPLTKVTVTDDKVAAADISCPVTGTNVLDGTLAPGDTVICSATLVAPAAGVQHTNVATVVGVPPQTPGNPPTVTDTNPANATPVEAPAPAITIKKYINGDDANTAPGASVAAGADMAIRYDVVNTGNTELTNVTVTDDKVAGAAISCTPGAGNVIGSLAPAAKASCTATLAAPAPGVQHTNTGTVTGTDPDGTPVSEEDPANAIVPATPAITIVKKINGDDANTAPGASVAQGSAMAITYDVTNTGNQPLTSLVVSDDKVTAISCPQTTLAVGETIQCTASLAAPAPGVQHTNTGTATANPPANPDGTPGTPVTDDDPANAIVPAAPAIQIVKSINGDDANTAPGVSVTAGSTMDITYLVTNTGNVPVTGVTVTDDKPVQDLSCPATTLAAGAKMTCTATLVAPAAGVQHTNVGTVTATPPANPDGTPGTPVTDDDPANANVPATPGIGIVKYINGNDANTAPGVSVTAGSTMAITYLVTNTGNVPLTGVAVTDDKPVKALSCPQTTLAVGEAITCTATLAAPAAGVQHTNVGTVTAAPPANPDGTPGTPVTDDDPANASVPAAPAIKVVKSINGDDANTAPGVSVTEGSTMNISYLVTNTGNQPLTGLVVSDDKVTSISCPVIELAVGASTTCTATLAAPAPGVQHTNVGTATANPPANPDGTPGTPVTDDDPANAIVPAAPAIKVVKAINGDDANTAPGVSVTAGAPMTITYDVTNTGNQPLTNVTLTDDKPVVGLACPQTTLAVDETMQCTATLAAPAAGVQHTNTATVVGTPPTGATVTDKDPANALPVAAPVPSVSIVKSINGDDANTAPGVSVAEGSTMDITYLVTNTGQTALTGVAVTDDNPVQALSCPATTLAAGATMSCTATLAAPAPGVQHTNVGTVTATPPNKPDGTPGTPVTDKDPANATVPAAPAIRVIKKINGDDANTAPGVSVAEGSTMAITYDVTNTGNQPLTSLVVSDDKVTAISCPQTSLAVGETIQCTATLGAPAPGGQHTNVGTATANPPANPDGTPGNPVTDDDPANAIVPATASISIVKSINGDDANTAPGVSVTAGKDMNITYLVTNTGNQLLTKVAVTDDKVPAADIACEVTELAPGASMTCTATLAAPAAGVQHTNVGTVTGTPVTPDGTPGTPVGDDDPANALPVAAPQPAIQIIKAINGDDADIAPGVTATAGSTMGITYVVTNVGQIDLQDVSVTDDNPVQGLSCPATTLAIGESMTCSATLAAPAPGVQHKNIGAVVATPVPEDDGSPSWKGPNGETTVTDDNPANAHVLVTPEPTPSVTPEPTPEPSVTATPKPSVAPVPPSEPSPPTRPAPAGPVSRVIARAGSDIDPVLLGAGAVSVVAGAGFLMYGRRRRDEE